MTTIKNIIIHLLYSLAVVLPYAVYATDPLPVSIIEKRRNIIKIFEVKNSDMLLVDNQFGQVKINLWEKNEIKVEIVITASTSSESRADQYLAAVDIEELREKNKINLTTRLDKAQFGSNFSSNNKGGKNFIKIDYTVFMPKENALIVRNKFGNTDIPSFLAPLVVDSKHGTFSAVSLAGTKNMIEVRFGTAQIGKMEEGKLESHYSNVRLDHVSKLLLNNKFGELTIGDIKDLEADIAYSGVKIGTIRGSSNINVSYSKALKVDEIKKTAENMNIKAAYSLVLLPAESNSFNVTVTYGDFNYPSEKVHFMQRPSGDEQHHKSRQYQGKIGTGSGTKITVVSKFGNVELRD